MSWQGLRYLQAPLPGLPRQAVAYPSPLTIRLQLGSDPVSTPNPTSVWLRELSGDDTLVVDVQKLTWSPEQLPPPWRSLVWRVDQTELDNTLKAELLFSLRLLGKKNLGEQPYCAEAALKGFAQRPDHSLLINEALFFAFFDTPNLFIRQGATDNWLNAVQEVIFERTRLGRIRGTDSHLINLGYGLLTQVQQLRESNWTVTDIEQHWQTLAANHNGTLPASYAVVFFGEAVYCLTERGDMDGANQLLKTQSQALRELVQRLPGLDTSDLLGGMWCHHLGRLAYYRGDFGNALTQFAQEWQFNKSHNETNRLRLKRSSASVLTDLGFLAAAEQLARQACQAQDHTDEEERYKTYGRLAEILLRQGRYLEAKDAYQKSWDLQQNQAKPAAQTPVYLGHTHLLLNGFDTAQQWYQTAETIGASRFDPYLCMGLAALFTRTKQPEKLAHMWLSHEDALTQLRGVKVLPTAVIQMARFKAGQIGRQTLQEVFAQLQAENYWLEACYLLPALYPEPCKDKQDIKTLKEKLENLYQEAIRFCHKTQLNKDSGLADNFSLQKLLADLEQATSNQHWENCSNLNKIYPFKLLG